jgi:spermidine synthase
MTSSGALTLHLGSPFSHPARVRESLANLRQVFERVTPYFVHIPLYGSIWGFACASDALDPRAMTPEQVEAVISQRKLSDLQYYNGETHRAVFAIANYVKPVVDPC